MNSIPNAFSVPQALAVAAQLQQSGKNREAAALYSKVLEFSPENEQAALQLARIYNQNGQQVQARNILESAIKEGARNFHIFYMAGALQHVMKSYSLSEHNIKSAIQLEPKSADAHNILGSNYIELNQRDLAIDAFNKSIELNPDSPDAHNNLAWVYRALGEKQKAIEHFEAAIKLDPMATEALSGLSLLKTYQKRERDFDLMEALLKKPDLSLKQRTELEFALGKANEDIEDYPQAFEHFKQGNTIWRKTSHYFIELDQSLFNEIKSTFPDTCKDADIDRQTSSHTVSPIFILGMPRSSTSLIEQILASHSLVSGAGELTQLEQICMSRPKGFSWSNGSTSDEIAKMSTFYLDNLAKNSKDTPWVTDKMPQNFRFIGPILSLFPNAKIIHCRRHPYDTCLSLYKHHFPMASHPYSYDLKELGQYYLLYEELMAHWHKVAPGKIYDIQYEELVVHFEREVKQLLAYCDLEFEQSCLDFHLNKRVVRTASSEQVRQSLYSNASGRWKHYSQQLQPLIATLPCFSNESIKRP